MCPRTFRALGLAAGALLAAACQGPREPTAPENPLSAQAAGRPLPASAQQRADWFHQVSPEVMALPRTVFADDDESSGLLVFGVEAPGVIPSVRSVLSRFRIPSSAYRIEVTEPIRAFADLRDEFRPTVGGIQIVFKGFLCSLGFNADQAGERSFYTTSHCSSRQGAVDGTDYYQPNKVVPPQFGEVIADEVEDPAYFRGGDCSQGRKCRYSDAARALYRDGVQSNQGKIARTAAANDQSIDVVGEFTVTQQDAVTTDFTDGTTVGKVGVRTGWTEGEVDGSCVTVNVFGSNVQLLCQTFVVRAGAVIGGSGDSGAPVFLSLGSNNVSLVGILWGGNESGTNFIFSPLASIVAELGALTATAP